MCRPQRVSFPQCEYPWIVFSAICGIIEKVNCSHWLFLIIILIPICVLVIYDLQSSIAFAFLNGLSYVIPRELGGTGLAALLSDCAIAHLRLNCRSVTCLKESEKSILGK